MIKVRKRSQKSNMDDNKVKKSEKVVPDVTFPIVAIGASAGGLAAFEKFFMHLTPCGMAYVIITHLDRDHISILPDMIKKYTEMPVIKIKTGTVVAPDTIYVIPPKTNIILKNNILKFVKQHEIHYKNQPINVFLQSLAAEKSKNAIAVILSGSGDDGAERLRDINDNGGLIIVQNPATAAYDGMPRAAINTGLVDYVMDAEDIFIQLKKYLDYGMVIEGKYSAQLQKILSILRLHTGHDFTHYKLNTVCRRIEKQMFGHHIKTLAEYICLLRKDKNEINNLLKDLLIGVTRFFRDKEAFDALKNAVVLPFLKNLPNNYCLRVWVPACSTGEEAYSIAMLLSECMDDIKKYINVQIFATDIDLSALNIARRGIYPESISNDLSPERLNRFFTKKLKNYIVKSDIRRKIIFGEQNIIKDPPFTKLDFISCRNLLIYLDTKLQKKVLSLLHYSLKPNGTLFLGMSEATSGFTDYFELLTKKYKIFRRKDAESSPRAMLGFDVMPRILDFPVVMESKLERSVKSNIKQTIETFIVDNYTAPCAVIDINGDIIYKHGSTEHYIKSSSSNAKLNVATDTHKDIKLVLIPLLHKVLVNKKEQIFKNLKVKIAKKTHEINLHVIPIHHIKSLNGYIFVIFEDIAKSGMNKSSQNKLNTNTNQKNSNLKILMEELKGTKENLQASIEELETGNEELQSANEELQSTNEEIETSKEELQSLNEELIIVNTEMQSMIDQLSTVNDDMNNLFNSTEIAAFFLDNELRIKRFTPKAQEFMHLIKTDVGRSFSHFSTNIKSASIVENAESVLKTLVQKSYEVETDEGHWYNIRILPYRTLTNMIDGVVITLTDITTAKKYEANLLKLNQAFKNTLKYTENIINIAGMPVIVLNYGLKIIIANNVFFKTFKISDSLAIDTNLFDVKHKAFYVPKLQTALGNLISKSKPIANLVIKIHTPNLKSKSYTINANIIPTLEMQEKLIFMTLEHLHE